MVSLTRKKPFMNDSLMRSFGRVNGRKLGAKQQYLVDNLLSRISVNLTTEVKNIKSIFDLTYKDYIVEVGFGKGEHLAKYAMENPDVGFVGCEPYINGVANMLRLIDDNDITNIKIVHGDARLLFEVLPKKVLKFKV